MTGIDHDAATGGKAIAVSIDRLWANYMMRPLQLSFRRRPKNAGQIESLRRPGSRKNEMIGQQSLFRRRQGNTTRGHVNYS